MIYHSTQSNNYLWQLISPGKQKKTARLLCLLELRQKKTNIKTSFSLILDFEREMILVSAIYH